MKRTLLRILAVVVWSVPALAVAQEASITGVVTDQEGSPLPGATISIPSLTLGAATDMDGRYELTVPARLANGQTVRMNARFVGYATSERNITLSPGRQTQNFTLALDLLDLDEIVVTGVVAGTPQKKLAFSVGKVSADKLQEVPAGDPATALQGKVAGAKVTSRGGLPGSAPSVRLRGSTAISGSQEPLYIVDGIILEGTLADINAQDIESIEVVKGAAAASLYGSRAANGVVQIFTKRGNTVAEGRTQVTLRNEFGRSFLGRQIPLATHHPYLTNSAGEFVDASGNVIAPGQSRILKEDAIADSPYQTETDWQREIFEPGDSYSNYVAVARNAQNGNYQVSFENSKEQGILFGQKGFDRQNLRVNLDQQIVQGLNLSVSSLYGQSTNDLVSQGPGSPFFTLLFIEPSANLLANNPAPFDDQAYYLRADPYSNEPNPLYELANRAIERNRTRFLGNVRTSWNPVSWFGLEGNVSLDRATNVYEDYFFKGYLREDDSDPLGVEPGPGSLSKSTFNERAINSGLTASVNHAFGPLTSRLRLSYLYEDYHYESFNASGSEFAVVGVPDLGALQSSKSIDSYIQDVRSENLFAIVGLDLYDRYIADFLIRRDGSSLFGEDERYATYYRASGAYRLSEDVQLPGINELRLRASIGTAGLRPPFAAQYEVYSISGGVPTKSVLGNSDLKPAKSTEVEYGINLDFLDRFSFELTYADTEVEDQILIVPLSAASGGFTAQYQNAGTLASSTWEATLNSVLLQRSDVRWTFDITFDRTRQKVTELNRLPFYTGPSEQNADIFYVKEGEIFGVAYGNRWARSLDELGPGRNAADYEINSQGYVIPKGTEGTPQEVPVKAVDADGNTTFAIMDINPDFNMGFGSSFRVGGLSAYMLFDWQQGGQVYNQTKQWTYRERRHGDMDQSGVPAGERKSVNYYAAFYDANNASDYFVEDASYLKLRELSLRYTFGQNLLNRWGVGNVLQRASLSLIGRNLFTVTGYSGYDPEVAGVSGDATNFKFDGFGYPNFRTFTGAIELVF